MKVKIGVLFFSFIISVCTAFSQKIPTIAVLQLQPYGISEPEAELLTDHLRLLLVQTDSFVVVEREAMNEILNEQGFQQMGCTSRECAVQVGRILGVQKMLTGSVGKFGSLYTIVLMIIDVESSRIENSSSYNYKGEMEKLLTEGIEKALYQLINIPERGKIEKGQLSIESRQKDVRVFIDGKYAGNTPLNLNNISVGEHELIFKKEGFISDTIRVVIKSARRKNVNVNLTPQYGYLTVLGSPEKASIFIDDRKIGKIPLKRSKVNVGVYRLKVHKKGYQDFYSNIVIRPEENTEVNIDLKKLESDQSLFSSTGQIERKTTSRDSRVESDNSFPSKQLTRSNHTWGVKLYFGLGFVEPWGYPGSGAVYDMGFRVQGGLQVNPGMFVQLPGVLKPVSLEILGGYSNFKGISDENNTTSVIMFNLLGRYELTDLIAQYVGFEYPALSFFGLFGLAVENQSWDWPGYTIDPYTWVGYKAGLGVKYRIDPIEIDVRVEQANFLKASDIPTAGDEYNNNSTGIMIGIGYAFM